MILGLCGAAGAGKNTVADRLCDTHGWAQFGFADPVYAAVSAAIGVPVEHLRDRARKERPIEWLGKSPRELLQTLGTEWGRSMVRDDIWVAIAMQKVERCLARLKGVGGVVLTDVRFANEVAAIKAAGGLIWKVSRPEAALAGDAARHSSEAGIAYELVDAEIINGSTVAALNNAVDATVRRLLLNTMKVSAATDGGHERSSATHH
jgi:hypothetical protein